MAGKNVKCQCGVRFRLPSPAPTQAEPPLPRLSCPHCQQEVQPNWKACPACGQRLPAIVPPLFVDQLGKPQPDATTIRTGDNSFVKAVVNQRLNTRLWSV